jgi:Domain of unknown function DUF29
MEQAALLREGRLASADIANIAEEIESTGRVKKRELVDQLAIRSSICSSGTSSPVFGARAGIRAFANSAFAWATISMTTLA